MLEKSQRRSLFNVRSSSPDSPISKRHLNGEASSSNNPRSFCYEAYEFLFYEKDRIRHVAFKFFRFFAVIVEIVAVDVGEDWIEWLLRWKGNLAKGEAPYLRITLYSDITHLSRLRAIFHFYVAHPRLKVLTIFSYVAVVASVASKSALVQASS